MRPPACLARVCPVVRCRAQRLQDARVRRGLHLPGAGRRARMRHGGMCVVPFTAAAANCRHRLAPQLLHTAAVAL